MIKTTKRVQGLVFVSFLALGLMSCGGGDGGDTTPVADTSFDQNVTTGGLNSLAYSILVTKTISYPYRFIVVSDTQPEDYECQSQITNPVFESHLDLIVLLEPKPDFVLIPGDLVCTGMELEYLSYVDLVGPWMKRTQIPVFSVPGNHEFYSEKSFTYYNEYIGNRDYYFEWGDAIFILLNNVQHPGDPQAIRWWDLDVDWDQLYRIEENQLDTLRLWLKDAPPLRFAVTHLPSGYEYEKEGYNEYLDILDEFNFAMVFEGHRHIFHRYIKDRINHVIAGGGGGRLFNDYLENPPISFGHKHFFLMVNVSMDGDIGVDVYFFNEGPTAESLQYEFVIQGYPKNHKYTYGEPIQFGEGGNSEPFLRDGWSYPGMGPGTWTDGIYASMKFEVNLPISDIELIAQLTPFLVEGMLEIQRVIVSVNGKELETLAIDSPGEYIITIPKSFMDRSHLVLEFDMPDAGSPIDFDVNSDIRQLSVRWESISLNEAAR